MIEEQIRFGKLVKEYRERMFLTQKELGQRVGLTDYSIHRIEKGKNSVSLKKAVMIANALYFSLGDIQGEFFYD